MSRLQRFFLNALIGSTYLITPVYGRANSHKHVGKCALCSDIKDGEFIIHGMNLLRIVVNKGIILPKFLYYYFRTSAFKESIDPFIIDAVNQSSINTTNLSNIQIPVPSIDEQKAIVEELEKYEVLIAVAKDTINSCDSRKQSILNKYLK